jgi:hypothetical protein
VDFTGSGALIGVSYSNSLGIGSRIVFLPSSHKDIERTRGMSAVPTGLRGIAGFAYPTLKRGANNHCAYGAGRRETTPPTARATYGASGGALFRVCATQISRFLPALCATANSERSFFFSRLSGTRTVGESCYAEV